MILGMSPRPSPLPLALLVLAGTASAQEAALDGRDVAGVHEAIADAHAAGTVVVVAAGNTRTRTWSGNFDNSSGGVHRFLPDRFENAMRLRAGDVVDAFLINQDTPLSEIGTQWSVTRGTGPTRNIATPKSVSNG